MVQERRGDRRSASRDHSVGCRAATPRAWPGAPDRRLVLVLAGVAALSAGCTGKTSASGALTVDAGGATVTGVDGAAVAVAPGAVDGPVTIRIARDASGAAALPPGSLPAGPIYALTPHGIQFARPAAVRIPFDPSTQPEAGAVPMLFKASSGGDWTALAGTRRDGDALVGDVDSFSYFVVRWCSPTAGGCWPGGRDVTMSVVSPAPSPVTSGPPGLLQPVDLTLQVTRPTLLVLRATLTVLDFVPVSRHTVFCKIVKDNGAPVGGGIFSSDDWKFPGSVKTFDVQVPLTEGDSGLHSYHAEVYCEDVGFGTGCTGQLGGGIFPIPEVPAYHVSSAPVLVNVAFPPGTPPDPSMLPLFDTATSGFVLPADAGGGVTSRWTRPILGGASQFITLQADTAQPLNHRWQISSDGGLTWADWRRPQSDDPTPCQVTPSYCFPYGFTAGMDGVRHSQRTICVDLPHSPCPRDGAAPFRDWPIFTSTAIDGLSFRVVATNAYGEVTGPAWSVASALVGMAPVISAQPAGLRVVSGETASFTVVATGAPDPTYQWQRLPPGGTWQDVAGATAATYTTPPLAPADSGTSYRVKVTNSEASVMSDPAAVIVDTGAVAPWITSQPLGLAVVEGSEAVLAVVADGSAPLSYQWRRDGVDLPGANAPMLKLPAVSVADAGDYSVRVSNAAGAAVSLPATLTVAPGGSTGAAPAIVTPPASVTVAEGQAVSFAVGASGSGPLSYQWLKDGAAIAGATAAVHAIAAAAPSDAGAYAVIVTNALGTATSAPATLAVSPPAGAVAPSITTQPTGVVAIPGEGATFAVAATGSGPLSYGWRKDGVAIPGAGGPVLSIAGVGSGDAGTYDVVVSNAAGSATSAGAALVVLGAPVIAVQPQAASVPEGASATFAVEASGTALRYLWLRNQVAIDGATSASYTTPAVTLADDGAVYSVLVYNNAGAVFSAGALLTVGPPLVAPVFTLQPRSVTVVEGQPAGFTAVATGTPTPTVRWYRGDPLGAATEVGSPCDGTAGQTTCQLATAPLSLADSGAAYFAIATDGVAAATSGVATVTVLPAGPPASGGACTGVGPGDWCWLQPAPTSNDLTAVTLDGSTVYAVGPRTTLASGDGLTWAASFHALDGALWDLVSPAPGVLLAGSDLGWAGSSAGIHRSTDGGATWTRTLADASIAGLAFTDASTGVAVGVWTGPGIWRTVDGGSTWAPAAAAPATGWFARVAVADAGSFVAVGSAGAIQRSTDGGATWAPVDSGTVDDLVDVAFAPGGAGVAITGLGAVLRSSDGGATWSAPEALSPDGLGTVAFADATTVVAMGTRGAVQRSTDGGQTWTAGQDLNLAGAELISRLVFRDGSEGYAVGSFGQVWRTTDGGAWWDRVAGGSDLEHISSLRPGPAQQWLAAGGGGVLFTGDDGASWTTADVVPALDTARLDDTTWLAVGFGWIRRTGDGGATWTTVRDQGGVMLMAVDTTLDAASQATAAVAVGSTGTSGVLLRSVDGGATWLPVGPGAVAPLQTVRFDPAAPGVGLAGGWGATLLRTTDAGATWTVVPVPALAAGEGIRALRFAGTAAAVFMASDGGIYRSGDGGLTWTKVYSSQRGSMNDVAPLEGSAEVVAVGVAGTIATSLDGGLTWATSDLPITATLTGVGGVLRGAPAGRRLLEVGDAGTVLRSPP